MIENMKIFLICSRQDSVNLADHHTENFRLTLRHRILSLSLLEQMGNYSRVMEIFNNDLRQDGNSDGSRVAPSLVTYNLVGTLLFIIHETGALTGAQLEIVEVVKIVEKMSCNHTVSSTIRYLVLCHCDRK